MHDNTIDIELSVSEIEHARTVCVACSNERDTEGEYKDHETNESCIEASFDTVFWCEACKEAFVICRTVRCRDEQVGDLMALIERHFAG